LAHRCGEEFAAILPGADPLEAVGTGEAERRAFANSGAFADDLAVGARLASVLRLIWKRRAISAPCSALPRPRSTWPSARAAIASNCAPDDANPPAEIGATLRSTRRKPAIVLVPLATKLTA